jgi:hypothetical protein
MRGVLAVLLATGCLANAEEPKLAPWPPEGTAEVRAYVFSDHLQRLILDGEKINGEATDHPGVVLTEAQVERLNAIVRTEVPFYGGALCFEPRNAFVYFDKDGNALAAFNICFECIQLRTQPEGLRVGNVPNDFPAFAELVEELDLPVGKYPSAAAFKETVAERRQKMEQRRKERELEAKDHDG